MKNYAKDLIALFTGASLTLAFAPYHLFPLAIIAPMILYFLWQNISLSRTFWRGWLFGLGLFGAGIYWIFISVHDFGNASIPISLLITVGLIAFLALFPALNGWLLNRYFRTENIARLLLVYPVLWVFMEWFRSSLLTGFTWLTLGYSQLHTPLSGYAPIISVYGISLLTVLTGTLMIAIVRYNQQQLLFTKLLLGLVGIWIVGTVLTFITWTVPFKSPVSVSLVQGNIPQELKWSPEEITPTLDRYIELTKSHWNSKIIIWPEGAIPVPLQNVEEFIQTMADKAKHHDSTFITGIPIQAEDPETPGYYNAVIAVGEGKGVYLKQRLVPFGEFTPMPKFLGWLMNNMDIPMSNFIPGKKGLPVIEAAGIKIATFICYEIAFAEQVLSHDKDIGMILTVTNDAWFGHSIAQAQHLEMAQMRALEMGRPVLFVSNNGITAVIDAKGKIQSAAPPFKAFVLSDLVQAMTGETPWQKRGLDPLLMAMLLMLFYAIRLNIKSREKIT